MVNIQLIMVLHFLQAFLYEFHFTNQIVNRTKIRCIPLTMVSCVLCVILGILLAWFIGFVFFNQSRIVQPRKDESNFRIFYQLFAGLSPQERGNRYVLINVLLIYPAISNATEKGPTYSSVVQLRVVQHSVHLIFQPTYSYRPTVQTSCVICITTLLTTSPKLNF
jgi:hypothetical protein